MPEEEVVEQKEPEGLEVIEPAKEEVIEPVKAEAPVDKKTPKTCSTVMPNGTCGTCGWKWGSAAPHPVYVGAARHEPIPTKTKPAFTPPAPDPKACSAIQFDGVCPKCGWTKGMRDGIAEPHPVN